MARRILVLPHIGTSLGHLIRIGTYLSKFREIDAEYSVCIPRTHLAVANKFLPDFVSILPRDDWFYVNNSTGRLLFHRFAHTIRADIDAVNQIRPHFIVGDPGLRAGIVGIRTGIPWGAIIHGCYLDLPKWVDCLDPKKNEAFDIATYAWKRIHDYLDELVTVGSEDSLSSWHSVRKTGRLLIPSQASLEPLSDGEFIGALPGRFGEDSTKTYPLVFTTCTGDKTGPPDELLRFLVSKYEDVAFVGSNATRSVKGVTNVGNKFSLASLINENSTVICHGGHGTLNTVLGLAKRVIAIPGDLDQLCNSLIAGLFGNVELPTLGEFRAKVTAPGPLVRTINWSNVQFDSLS